MNQFNPIEAIRADGKLSDSETAEYQAWHGEHEKRLAKDPAYFAFVAMQNSGTKHGNKKSPARDQYYFGTILYTAIEDHREMLRLFAMAELTEEPQAPFADARSNYLLAALHHVHESDNQEPTLEHVVDVLDQLGLLDAAGGRFFVERNLNQAKQDAEHDIHSA